MKLTLLNIHENDVVYEDHEDEMIFLHLKNGFYYTLDRTGADCAVALLRAGSLDEALSWLERRYLADRASLQTYCEKLVADLLGENLVCPRVNGASDEAPLAASNGKIEELLPYRLEKYEDIQDILKFDPVHEVGEDGWPSIVVK
jgi:hypothetical protein